MGVAQIPKGFHVPVAAFFDLPRPVKNALRCPCGGERSPFSSSSCQRCFKRRARERFVSRWTNRFPDYSAATALADIIAPQRNSDFLDAAIASAIASGSEVEAFRAALEEEGQRIFVDARDERAASLKRGGAKPSAFARQVKRDLERDVPLTVETMARVRELLRSSVDAFWWNTGTHWSERDHIDVLLLCKARVKLESAANALRRSPESIAWRASDAGMTLPPDWRSRIATTDGQPASPRRVPLAYPFTPRASAHGELLYAVNALVPRSLPGREDVCQEILVAVLTGEASLGDLQTKGVRAFTKRFKRENFEAGGYAASFDDPISEDSKTTIGERIAARRSFELWEKL